MPSGDVLTFPATPAGFADAFGRFRQSLDRRGLAPKIRYRSELAFDEVVSNILRHAYHDQRDHEIRVMLNDTADSLVLIFEDDGVSFDPSSYQPPDTRLASLEETPVGGRGLLLVRSAARRIDYERTVEGHNRLMVTIDKTE